MTDTVAPPQGQRRSWRRRWWPVVAVAAAAAVGAALFLFQPWQLFTTTIVDDALPAGVSAGALTTGAPGAAVGATAPGAAPARASGPVVLATGEFRSFEHETSGTATLFTAPDGTVVLRLSGFATSNGPDVKVWLSKASADDAPDARTAGYLDLGVLKGNRGNQNYLLPAGAVASGYTSVVVWCDRFSVPFGAAPLERG